MFASKNGHITTAELLIAKGANLEAGDTVGEVFDIHCLRKYTPTERVGTESVELKHDCFCMCFVN
jgi:hypothetical protein